MHKPRILWLGESSYLNTGYSTYTKEILTRLYNTNKYEIAEFGIYGHWDDPNRYNIPWTFYGNIPDKNDKYQVAEYHKHHINQFGAWRFEEVCLDFHPDIVCSIRDFWMEEFVQRSPFRNFYKWIYMPPIDSVPNYEQWLYTYLDADKLLGYTQFCADNIKKISKDKFYKLASPGADANIFKPVEDKKQLRAEYGFQDDIFIIGTVMRNMGRKLFPDLIETFATFCNKYKKSSENVYLFLHTSYPDLGWDIPKLLRNNKIAHKVLFTYVCKDAQCQHVFPSFFNGLTQSCPKCGNMSGNLPNSKIGVTRKQLATIMNWMDIYVQYSCAESCGMPLIEAAYCGLPIFAVDYSGMSSIIKDLHGYPIRVERFFNDVGSHAKRALPDNNNFIEAIIRYIEDYRNLEEVSTFKKLSPQKLHELAQEYYSYDKAAKIWEECIDSFDIIDHKHTWFSPSKYVSPSLSIPQGLNDEEFAKFIICHVWGRPDKINSYTALRLSRDINYQLTNEGICGYYFNEMLVGGSFNYKTFTRQDAVNEMLKLNEFWKYWDYQRLNPRREKPLYIQMAKGK